MFPVPLRYNSVSFFLIILMVAIFAYGMISGEQYQIMRQFGVSTQSPIYTWFTSALIHGGYLHIAMNMFVMLQVGPIVESLMSRRNFILFTILSAGFAGYGGAWLMQALDSRYGFIVGFSGVIFAYIGVLFRVTLDRARDKKRALRDIFERNLLLVAFLIFPFFVDIGISGEAHLMGFLFGLIAAPIFGNWKAR